MNRAFSLFKHLPKSIMFSFLFSSGMVSYYMESKKRHIYALARASNVKLEEYFEELDIDRFSNKYPNLTIIRSKAIDVLVGKLRDVTISREQFRIYSKRIVRLIVEEALAQESDEIVVKQSPLGYYKTFENPHNLSDYIAVSILRSGNAMVEEMMAVVPEIKVGKILVQRDENTPEKKTIFFFDKLPPNIQEKKLFVLDPMLATGGSVSMCINKLIEKGAKEENIIFLNLISCPEGIEALFKQYPKIKIITAKVDPILLPIKYIAPGIGDFGDRYYGTDL